jgi:hypothetical protein|tara:strand:+ start:234 stop:404 length:171 start_codon:yes stop_codon:yes gene_type:complete
VQGLEEAVASVTLVAILHHAVYLLHEALDYPNHHMVQASVRLVQVQLIYQVVQVVA